MSFPAIFLDRDGTINIEKNYLYRYEDWEWIPGALEALKLFSSSGYRIVVITNQAGVARGYYTEEDVIKLHHKIDRDLATLEISIDAYYFCPHHPDFGSHGHCQCRKPEPGLIKQAQKDLDINLQGSWLIGDKLSDINAGLSAGVRPVLVATGYGWKEVQKLPTGVPYVRDLFEASQLIL